MSGVTRRIANGGKTSTEIADATHEVVVIGGGEAGIAMGRRALDREWPISTSPVAQHKGFFSFEMASRLAKENFSRV